MAKRSRRARQKHRARRNPTPLAVREARRPQPSPLPPGAPAAQKPVAIAERADHYQYVIADVRRSLVIAGAVLLVLLILYFLT